MADKEEVVQVTKLKVKVGGETSELTVDQARKLYAALGELFGQPEKVRVEREVIYWPSPFKYDYQRVPWNATPTWTCLSGTGNQATGGLLSLEVS